MEIQCLPLGLGRVLTQRKSEQKIWDIAAKREIWYIRALPLCIIYLALVFFFF